MASTVVRCEAYSVAKWWTSSAQRPALQARTADLLKERHKDWLFKRVWHGWRLL